MWINIFYKTNIFLYTPENRNRIQPQVVLLCEHNIVMRILNKIQLIVEFRVSFMQVTKHRQFFTTWYIFITVRKRWVESTIGCIMLQTQHHNAILD